MNKTALAAISAAALLLAGSPGAALAGKAVPAEAVARTAVKAMGSSPTAVFDLAHSEIFSPVKQGPLNYTTFHDMLKDSGEEVGINSEPVTAARLARVKTYIIAGPAKPFSAEEVDALRKFVEKGGNLLVLLHVSQPVAGLTGAFGIFVSNFTIGETSGLIGGSAQDFFVSSFGGHPVTEGLGKVAVFGAWGLMAEGNALTIAATGPKAWADMDRNRKFDKGEPVQEFGIVTVAEAGKGKVVVVSDDAPFANRFIGLGDNKRLAENIIRWFRQ